jgi:hypothetical protein
VFFIADDLAYGDLGCYGQKRIRTPNIDRLADEGMRFTSHYSGHNVCAPSRCVLMTGLHPGHAYVRDNGPLYDKYGGTDAEFFNSAAGFRAARTRRRRGRRARGHRRHQLRPHALGPAARAAPQPIDTEHIARLDESTQAGFDQVEFVERRGDRLPRVRRIVVDHGHGERCGHGLVHQGLSKRQGHCEPAGRSP